MLPRLKKVTLRIQSWVDQRRAPLGFHVERLETSADLNYFRRIYEMRKTEGIVAEGGTKTRVELTPTEKGIRLRKDILSFLRSNFVTELRHTPGPFLFHFDDEFIRFPVDDHDEVKLRGCNRKTFSQIIVFTTSQLHF